MNFTSWESTYKSTISQYHNITVALSCRLTTTIIIHCDTIATHSTEFSPDLLDPLSMGTQRRWVVMLVVHELVYLKPTQCGLTIEH